MLYLETVTRSAEAEGKEIKQSKERDHYGHVRLTLDPQELGEQFQFINAIQHRAIPDAFIPTIQQAISKGLQKGVLKGFPVVDVVCTLLDGSYHDIDSSNEAFEKAALRALANGLTRLNRGEAQRVSRPTRESLDGFQSHGEPSGSPIGKRTVEIPKLYC